MALTDAGRTADAGRTMAGDPTRTAADPTRYRLIDRVALAYFGINSLILLHPNRPEIWPQVLLLHLVYLVGIPIVVRYAAAHPIVRFLREWYPILGITFMYGELQFLNQVLATGYHDRMVMGWEEALFGRQMAAELHRMVPFRPLGEAVHFGYFCYYLMLPGLFLPLWFLRRYEAFRVSMGVVGIMFLFCYAWYVYFPVTGPFWQLERPEVSLQGWFFPKLTYGIVSAGSSKGSAFPSSHIAATISVIGMAWRYCRPVYRVLVFPAVLLTIGTVYGGFHYAVDAVAGLILGLLWAWLGPRLIERVDGPVAGS